jgi:hypothetical protein
MTLPHRYRPCGPLTSRSWRGASGLSGASPGWGYRHSGASLFPGSDALTCLVPRTVREHEPSGWPRNSGLVPGAPTRPLSVGRPGPQGGRRWCGRVPRGRRGERLRRVEKSSPDHSRGIVLGGLVHGVTGAPGRCVKRQPRRTPRGPGVSSRAVVDPIDKMPERSHDLPQIETGAGDRLHFSLPKGGAALPRSN